MMISPSNHSEGQTNTHLTILQRITMRNDAYVLELLSIYRHVSDDRKSDFATRFNAQARNPVVIFGLSAFLGYFGIDRFMLGQVLLGILKLITGGGFGIWYLIDLFLVAGTARDQNLEIARSVADIGQAALPGSATT
jgi:TM2 domain-containing membrane protein YozV